MKNHSDELIFHSQGLRRSAANLVGLHRRNRLREFLLARLSAKRFDKEVHMRKFSILAAVMAAAITVSMTGCGSGTAPAKTEPEEKAPEAVTAEEIPEAVDAESDTQNPAMNYVGAYSDESGKGYSLLIQATDGVDGVMISVGHASEDGFDYSAWQMNGKIKDNVITYSNAVRVDESWDPESENGVSQEEVYTDGTGTFEITQDKKITWKDDKENEGEGLVFVWDQELYDKLQQMIEQNQDEDAVSAGLTAMDWAGPYVDENDDNMTMVIEVPEETGTIRFTVTKKGEGDQAQTWTMTGDFNADDASAAYTDCEKMNVRLDEYGETMSGDTVYKEGTGSFKFDPDTMTVTWKDDKEDAGKNVKFVLDLNANGSEEGSEGDYELMEGEMIDEPGEDIPEEEIVDEEEDDEDFMSEDADY